MLSAIPPTVMTEGFVENLEVLIFLLFSLLALVIKPFRHAILKSIFAEISQAKGNKVVSKEDNKIHRLVYQEIVGLRYFVNADRAEVFQFENGSRFSLSNPTWKMTETYEVLKDGLQYLSDTIQRTHISHFLDIILPLFGTDETIAGVTPMQVRVNENEERKVFKTKYSELKDSRYKFELLRRGLNTTIVIPLVDKEDNVFGLCSIGFSYDKKLDKTELCGIVKSVDKIQTYLNSLFNGR